MRIFFTLVVAAMLAGTTAAEAAKRVALIIGNDGYQNVSSLLKAREDAQGYREFFRSEGYTVIGDRGRVRVDDLDERGMRAALNAFYDAIEPGSTAVFIYSGHGWSNGQTTFAVPTDAPEIVNNKREIEDVSTPLLGREDAILNRMQAEGAQLRVVLFDACRDNPFKEARAGSTRSLGPTRGLAALPRGGLTSGDYLIFSADEGQQAMDRLPGNDRERYSVFTRHFLPELKKGVHLKTAFDNAYFTVLGLANQHDHEQHPQDRRRVNEKVCLAAKCGEQRGIGVIPNPSTDTGPAPTTPTPENEIVEIPVEPPAQKPKPVPKITVKVYEATDFNNAARKQYDLRRINEVSHKSCQRSCVDDRRCRYYTYNTKARVCFLKTNVHRTETGVAVALSGKVIRPGESEPAIPSPTQSQKAKVAVYRNTDFNNAGAPHYDLKRINNVSHTRCQSACVSEARCRFYTYNTKARVCFLKRNVYKTEAGVSVAVSGKVTRPGETTPSLPQSAPDRPVSNNRISRLNNTDLPGYDLRFTDGSIFTKTSLAGCERLCLSTGSCRAFTYNQKAGACFLKSAVGNRSSFAGAISGIKR